MKIIVGIPALGQYETLKKNVKLLIKNASEKPRIIVWDNGSTTSKDPVKQVPAWYKLIKSKKNIGVPQLMNKIMDLEQADYYVMIHSDVEIYEKDWDLKIKKAIEEIERSGNKVGVIGGFGSLQLGSNDINRTPYNKGQLGRAYNIQGTKNHLDADRGVKLFSQDYQPCITLDGYMLITRGDLRFWNNAPHHMYDHDICMEAINKGYSNWTINIDHNHQGGVSVCREDWTRDHEEFYKKWKHMLPQRHRNIFYY